MVKKVRVIKENLTQGKVSRVLLHFAIPLLLANVLQQFYQIIDSIIVGQYLGKEALAAVTASYPLFYFLISLVIGIGGGISVLVAHYYGGMQYKQVQRISSTYFIFLFAAGVIIAVLGILFSESIFRFIGTPEDVLPQAISYFRIYIAGTIFYITFNGFISILRGAGDSFTPLYLMLVSVLLNLVLDLVFVAYLGYGVEGAAYSTLIAQATALLLSVIYLNRNHAILSFTRQTFCFDLSLFKQGIKLGIPSGIQQSSIALGLVALLSIVNSFGTDALTAYGAVGRIESIIAQPMLTLGSALATFAGQNFGAQNQQRALKGLYVSLLWCLCISVVVALLAFFFGKEAIMLFNNESSVVEIGYTYLLIVFSFYLFNSIISVLNGFLRGVGDTFFPMLVSIISLWLIRLPLAYYWSSLSGEAGIWWSIVASWAIALLVTVLYYYSGKWRDKKVVLICYPIE